nr:hydrogenase iron-sulfur subunit [Candidatus Sigynarchaeum springense]
MVESKKRGCDIPRDRHDHNIVVFACNECGQGAFNTAGVARMMYDASVTIVPVQCSGMISPAMIMDALAEGADAVGCIGCCFGACHFVNGNFLNMHRVKMMKKLFLEMGYSDQIINHYTARAAEGETAVGDVEDILERLERAEKEGGTFKQ